MEEKLIKYLTERESLYGNILEIKSLDEKSSNHSNYKIKTTNEVSVARITHPQNVLSYSSLPDEFTILKLLEQYAIAPKAYSVDLEYFDTPLLFEEFIDGQQFSSLENLSQKDLLQCLSFLDIVSKIPINETKFPFKYTYTTYETNINAWQKRLDEVTAIVGGDNNLVSEFQEFFNKF